MVVYGWMPPIIVTGSLNFIQDRMKQEVFMFYLAKDTILPEFPFLDRWFIAAIPNSTFLKMLFQELDIIANRFSGSGIAYCKLVKKQYGKEAYRKIFRKMGL